MIKVLEAAIDKVKTLSEERQRYAADALERIASAPDDVYVLTADEEALVAEGLAELDRGETASTDEVRRVFDKYRA